MNMKLNTLIAAVVLAVSIPAQAAIDTGAAGNGSLLLTVLDRASGISALFDLGKNYSDFNVTGSDFANSGITSIASPITWNLSTDANYSAAWTALFANGAVAGNLTYGIMATDSLGGVNAGDLGYITTFKTSAGATFANAVLQTAAGNFDTYATKNTVGGLFNSHASLLNGADVTKTAGAVGTAFYTAAGKPGATSGPSALGAIGTSLGVAQYTVSNWDPSLPIDFANETVFGNGAQFTLSSAGTLVYSVATVAAVPEANTWAMAILGLGFMGFIARRKQA
jgi:hypothetical protein